MTNHVLNFVIFLAAMLAFEFFWRGFRRNSNGLPAPVLWILGYSLFLWLALTVISAANPDLLVVAMVCLIAGLLLRALDSHEPKYFAWLGIALAFGYLAKAILFPLAFVFLGVLLISKVSAKSVALAAFIFLSLSAPQIVWLSRARGHLTYSESGVMTLAWSNWGIPTSNWQGEPPGSGEPRHPTRQIYDHPPAFEFNGPIQSTYPPWYDPSYWNDGIRFHFVPSVVLRHVMENARQIVIYFCHPTIWLLAMLVFAFFSSSDSFAGVLSYWALLIPALAGFFLYSLTFTEFRYLPSFILLTWSAVLFGLRLRQPPPDRLLTWIAGTTAAVILASSAFGIFFRFGYSESDALADFKIVEELHQQGIHPGEKVAAIGFDRDVNWAYLMGISVVGEVRAQDTCEFWSARPEAQQAILNKFKQSGISLVVARVKGGMRSSSFGTQLDFSNCAHPDPSWKQLPDTTLLYFLN